jgi:hypothetical protein
MSRVCLVLLKTLVALRHIRKEKMEEVSVLWIGPAITPIGLHIVIIVVGELINRGLEIW